MQVQVDPECSIAYSVRGVGPPILMIQGVGVQGDGWLPQVEDLASRFTCITFDHRGIGQSEWSKQGKLTIEQLANDALAVLFHSGHQSAHIVGHSLGGTVAIALALQARHAIQSLSLICTFPSGRFVAPLTFRMLWLGIRASIGTRAMRRRGFLRIVAPPGPIVDAARLEDRLGKLFGHDIADQPPVAKQQLRALMKSDFTDRLGELEGIRTLVVSAEYDPIGPPASGQEIANRIPGSRFIQVQGASHGLPITHADHMNALLKEFIKPVTRSTG